MSPKKTALYPVHEKLGASFTDFGGWDMPLKYANDVAEHNAVRTAAGIFDLSHMGEFRVTGPDAAAFLDYALVSNMSILKVGKAKYSILVNAEGGVIDDLITYRLGENEFLVVPNAANIDKDFAAMSERLGDFDVTFVNESNDTSLIAVQGPKAEEILLAAGASDEAAVREVGYYAWVPNTIAGVEVLLARTGYTGEDGFELFVPNDKAIELWEKLEAAGEPFGLQPCGLASRDSLRLEAGMPLYGNELGLDITPFESGLGRLVEIALEKKAANFVGREALSELAKEASPRILVGLKAQAKRPARAHATLVNEAGEVVGEVTSGIPSPTLGYPVAMALVQRPYSELGSTIEVDIRGKRAPFDIVPLPFYKREK
ncbi:MAG: glycine cleavage system aminomethyltransferase GcvT [Rothia sp. (in: high G+C Gram-positive bacteria)]|uniref:glycine cleavage system aminomethyltransferase GcvT n=1 Tax=Rothia sp. (in: high G+C Gram-positive bacteria) TaxID=1885016 RepID=UPI0026E08640|nr:glycine cleavage system aminomethyltransferase GcvT [Rothia sp. (in: high G+C Gram-positive bacteria)]MDO5749937.1 glycine cleavage system aminomethyltransferase GcvT [Rothia sp. (in: high G+C Gram-positive bacteria)]